MNNKIQATYWNCYLGNWGDFLGKHIIETYSKKETILVSGTDTTTDGDIYTSIGSIIQWIRNPNTIIWGIGLLSEGCLLNVAPKKIVSVRGPLTRNSLLRQGFDCPESYGDPALLMSKMYNPVIEKKYKIGIIPHYIDSDNPWLLQFKDNPDVKVIDVKGRKTKEECFEFVDEVLECEIILSTSLHGIIVGDSYNIPSYWIELSNKVIGKGFKFRDYLLSVKRTVLEPFIVNESTTIEEVINSCYDYKIDIDIDEIERTCPFN